MAAVGGSAGSYGHLIVTPDMVPPDPAHWDAQAEMYRAGAASWSEIHEQISRDNAAFKAAADSPGFDEAHRAGAVLAQEALTIAEWHGKVAEKCSGIAQIMRETAAGQQQLIRDADAKIAAAKLPGEAQALVTTYHGVARYQTEAGVTAAMALHTSFKKSPENTQALDLLTKWGDLPTSPPAQPVDHTSPGIKQDDNDPWNRTHENGNNDKSPAQPPADPATGTSATQQGVGPGGKAPGAGTRSGSAAGDDAMSATGGAPLTQAPSVMPTPRQPAASPLGSGGMPSMGSLGGGGMGSGGMPKLPGNLGSGSGVSGMGANPLNGVLGQMPGGTGGLPSAGGVSGAGGGAGSPAAAAFSQGLSTGAGIGGGMSSAPPPTAGSPSAAALSAGASHAAPNAAAVSASPGAGVVPTVGQAGAVTPAVVTGAGTGSSGTPMILPPGSMGPPAATVPPPAAATMPAGTGGSTSTAAATSSATTPAANAGATLIPASVVAAGQTAAAQERRESPDAAAAKELAWKLQHAAELVRYPIDWAVGVFRSPSGTETVITSNDGAGYIPAGVFVPRSVHVLSEDPLVDEAFRQLWFGWSDPARVLIEYAQLRAEMGWKLVAAATTSNVSVFRDAGVEHPPSVDNPHPGVQVPAPALDGMHVHRLAVVWPDLYPRLLRIMDAAPIFQDRIVQQVTAVLIQEATTQTHVIDGGIPAALRQVWAARGGDRDPSVQQWAQYNKEALTFNVTAALRRPAFGSGAVADPRDTAAERADYRAHWLIARTAEHIGGWATRPLPLPDMCYAALATGGPGLHEMISRAVVGVEEDLQFEAR